MRHKARASTCFGGWGGIVLAALVGVAVAAGPALAKPKAAGAKRIAVLPPTDGTAKDAIITAKIAKALKQHKLQPVTGGAVKKAVATGVPSSDGEWIELARKLKVDGILEPALSGSGAKRTVEVVVHNGADGGVAGRETFAAKGPPAKLAAAVAAGLWKKLGSTITGTEPPKKDEAPRVTQATPSGPAAGAGEESGPAKEAAEPFPMPSEEKSEAPAKAPVAKEAPEQPSAAGEEEEEEFEQPKAKRGKDKSKPRAIEVEIGGRALQRLFEYTPSSAGKAYVEHFLPTFQGRAAWFPVTYAGLFLSGEFNPALKSGSNPAYPTGTRELVVGAQGRLPLSFGTLGLSAAYFQHLFIIGDTSNASDPKRQTLVWPDTAYQGARLAANARFYLWSFLQLGVEGAYRLVTNPGEGGLRVRSSFYFPNGKANYGLEGSAFVSVGLVSWLELRGGVDYRHYVFGALQPGSDNVNQTSATGATDRYLGFTLGVVGVYGGK